MAILTTFSLDQLKSNLNRLSKRASAKDLLIVILNWMQLNKKLLEYEPYKSYLIDYLNCNYNLYPIAYSSITCEQIIYFIRTINSFTNKDEERLVMLLRDILEDILVLEIEDTYSICGELQGLKVWFDEGSSQVVLECQYSYELFTLDGKPYRRIGHMRPATKDELKRVKLIE